MSAIDDLVDELLSKVEWHEFRRSFLHPRQKWCTVCEQVESVHPIPLVVTDNPHESLARVLLEIEAMRMRKHIVDEAIRQEVAAARAELAEIKQVVALLVESRRA